MLTFDDLRQGVVAPTVDRYIPAAGDHIKIRLLSRKRVKEIMGDSKEPTPEQSAMLLVDSLTDDDDAQLTEEQAFAMLQEMQEANPPLVFQQIMDAVGDVIKGEGADQGES